MRRGEFCLGVSATGLAAVWAKPSVAQARKARVSVVMGWSVEDRSSLKSVNALEASLRDLGWLGPDTLSLEVRWGAADATRTADIAKEVALTRPDVIVAHTTPVTAAVLAQTAIIPVVFVVVSDPVGSGFVESLKRPGRNVTGFINVEGSMGSKWLELLREVTPSVRRVGLLYNPRTAPYYKYHFDPFESGARAADVEPLALPVLTSKFQLIINLASAKRMQIEIPPSLLARADEVIE